MSYSVTMMPIREIPQSLAGEAALLGSIMLEPACLARILDSVPSAANAVYYAKIVIDYLQLMSIQEGRRYENRQQEITKISRSIKSLAMELEVPVLLLSQLNRAPASRSNFLPRLTDLRESGSIEQDADVVLLLHREDYYHRGERDYVKTNMADLIVAKQRNGPTGTVKLTFCPELARFENHTPVPA